MITIRTAISEDYQLLADLGRRAFYEAFGDNSAPEDMQAYLDLSFNPERIKIQLSDPSCTYFIGSYSGEPVGYAKIVKDYCPPQLNDTTCVQLERIYALKAYIGKKVGKTLMEECMNFAKQNNYKHMWLGVWQENHKAIEFYKRWGFKVIGIKQFVIGKEVNDDYVMAAEI
jgi:diamine N-acetyltransferase